MKRQDQVLTITNNNLDILESEDKVPRQDNFLLQQR